VGRLAGTVRDLRSEADWADAGWLAASLAADAGAVALLVPLIRRAARRQERSLEPAQGPVEPELAAVAPRDGPPLAGSSGRR
jgi:hypothetical protein